MIELLPNEKAAIAAGLWEPSQLCDEFGDDGCRKRTKYGDDVAWVWDNCDHTFYHRPRHLIPARDMHDPANLWWGLDNVDEWHGHKGAGSPGSSWYLERGDYAVCEPTLFEAFVALYDAEHPK